MMLELLRMGHGTNFKFIVPSNVPNTMAKPGNRAMITFECHNRTHSANTTKSNFLFKKLFFP